MSVGDPATRLYVAYNGWVSPIAATLPPLPEGEAWSLVIDTAADAADSEAGTPIDGPISVDGRSVIAAIAQRVR